MRLRGSTVESYERADDPERFCRAAAHLRQLPIWQHVRPSFLEPIPGSEVRMTRSLADSSPVGCSSNLWLDGETVRRSVVIAPEFWGRLPSIELSLIEIRSLFARGAELVTYRTVPATAHAAARIRRLGGQRDTFPGGLTEWYLTPEAFELASSGVPAHRD